MSQDGSARKCNERPIFAITSTIILKRFADYSDVARLLGMRRRLNDSTTRFLFPVQPREQRAVAFSLMLQNQEEISVERVDSSLPAASQSGQCTRGGKGAVGGGKEEGAAGSGWREVGGGEVLLEEVKREMLHCVSSLFSFNCRYAF